MKDYFVGMIVGALIAGGAVSAWHHLQLPAIEGKIAPVIANVPKETIPIKSVEVFTKPAKRNLNLPKNIIDNPAAHVISATTVTCDERDKTVTSVLNDDGKTTMFVKQDPLPWFRSEEALSLTLDYGNKPNGSTLRAGVRLDLAQTKALHFGVNGSRDRDGDWFYGAGIRITIR